MPNFQKIPYLDLRHEQNAGRFPSCIGRKEDIARLGRTLCRSERHHAIVTAPGGSGVTAFFYGFAAEASSQPVFGPFKLVMFPQAALYNIGNLPAAGLQAYEDALCGIRGAVVIIDNFGDLVYNNPAALHNWTALVSAAATQPSLRLVLAMDNQQLEWLKKNASYLVNLFETQALSPLSDDENAFILGQAFASLPRAPLFNLAPESIKAIIDFAKRFPALGQLPKAGVQLLDECMAAGLMRPGRNPQEHKNTHPVIRHIGILRQNKTRPAITPELVAELVSEKTGIPLQQLTADEREKLKNLPASLKEHIVGQDYAIHTVSAVIQRAKLGLKNPAKPLASFLALGPSGVGKTETAKVLAEQIFGAAGHFLRIDMSEFMEAHTVYRLIGAPPGYAGYDAGGQLTSHLKQFPYSLILLDEIEKAHPKVFDIFLQLLDDGRLTSGQGETVDATQAIVFATSNIGVQAIIDHRDDDLHSAEFYQAHILPELARHFRLEFINRFDGILQYDPLNVSSLVNIALLEIEKIEQRVKRHGITFEVSADMLRENIMQMADPRFGARPVKRFVEEMCETLITEKLLNS